MKKLLIPLAAAIVALSACGGSGSKAAAPTTPAPTTAVPVTEAPTTEAPTTTTVAPPTTTVPPPTTTAPPPEDPMETSRTIYAGLTSALNPALNAIYAKYGNPPSAKNLKASCGELAPLYEDFAKGVQSWTWPASVQNDADALAKKSATVAGDFYECANATTNSAANAGWTAAVVAAIGDEASAMRLALGMPIERS